MKDWLKENSKRGRVLGLYPGSLRRKAEVENPQSIHLNRVSNQLVHPKLLGHHDHLDWVHHRLALFLEEDLCQKDVPAVASFIKGLLMYLKGYVFIMDN